MTQQDQNRRLARTGTMTLAVLASVWILLVLPYFPGSSRLALPINRMHFVVAVGTSLLSVLSLLVAVGLGLFAAVRRSREARWYSLFLAGFAVATFFAVRSVVWGHGIARGRAIRNAEPILSALRDYKQAHGTFPSSLAEAKVQAEPGVLGISGYAYRLVDGEFELSFSIDEAHFNPEIVMYKPSGKYVGENGMPRITRDGEWGYFVFD